MAKVKVFSAYDLPPDVPQIFSGPSMTRQEFIDNGNVNAIVDEFTRTGFMPDFNREPVYADVSAVPSFREAQDIIIAGNKAFEALPAAVRKRLRTPLEFMEFLADPENADEARKLGLLKPKEAVKEAAVPPATSPAEPPLQAKPAQGTGA